MLLDTTTKSIEALLGGAPAANQPVFTTAYIDHTTTTALPAASDGIMTGVTPVTLVASPGGSPVTQRQVMWMSVNNLDTSSITITIRLNNNGTYRTIYKVTIAAGETILYSRGQGFQVLDVFGLLKQGGSFIRMAPLLQSTVKDAANLTAVTAFTTGACHIYYMGVAPFASSSINLLVNVTALVATITWAEIAVYKGTPNLNAVTTDFYRLGYLDVAAIYNSTGRKNNAISLGTPANPGDHLWIMLGSSATTPFQIRGALADDLQTGLFQTYTGRPSTSPGPVTGVLGGATAVPGWVAIRIN